MGPCRRVPLEALARPTATGYQPGALSRVEDPLGAARAAAGVRYGEAGALVPGSAAGRAPGRMSDGEGAGSPPVESLRCQRRPRHLRVGVRIFGMIRGGGRR